MKQMRRWICCAVLALCLLLAGCAYAAQKPPERDAAPSVAVQERVIDIGCTLEPPLEDMAELARSAGHIVVAGVTDSLPVKRIQLDGGRWGNRTPLQLQVAEAIKGGLRAGDTVVLELAGGVFEGIAERGVYERVTERYEGRSVLEKGETYILFMEDGEMPGDVYSLCSWSYGWIQRDGDGIRIDSRNDIVTADTFDGAIAEVKAAVAAGEDTPEEE